MVSCSCSIVCEKKKDWSIGGRNAGEREGKGNEHGSWRGAFFRHGYEKRHLEFTLSAEFTASARRMKETDGNDVHAAAKVSHRIVET